MTHDEEAGLNDPSRRTFVKSATAAVGAPLLSACGGGGGASASSEPISGTSPAPAPAPSPAPAPAPAPSPDPAPAPPPAPAEPPPLVPESPIQPAVPLPSSLATPDSSLSLVVASPFGHRAAPFTVGCVFRKGDVPQGRSVSVVGVPLQVVPKNRWLDGSLKFAILSGRVALSGGQPKVLKLSVDAAADGSAPLALRDLTRTRMTASFSCGAFGQATWVTDDLNQPFMQWVSGPEMSSWIYRKPVAGPQGTDAHLVAWMEVRLCAGGDVEVLPWIENGYLRVAAPTNKKALYQFTLGGVQRVSVDIDLKHHQRTPLIQGTALSYWLHHDLQLVARQDSAYLQATELVPTYRAQVQADAGVVIRLPATYTPMQAGGFIYDGDSMASSGYQPPIGLLPEQDVLFLTSTATASVSALVRNGYSAGRYGIHYRDENTQRPLRFSQFPTLVMADGSGFKDNGSSTTGSRTPIPTGGNPPTWDTAHSPSVGYLAYLATGRWYFMEETQFAATANYLGNGDNMLLRTGSKGLVKPEAGAWQTRSCAWDWRARVQALAITPDDDVALRQEFIASVEANINYFHDTYIVAPSNPLGFIRPGETYNNSFRDVAVWQQDFVTAAFGFSRALELPIAPNVANKLAEFFSWKARSTVFRLGPSNGFWYVNGAPFTVAVSPGNPNFRDGSGPWYTNPADVYAATYAASPTWLSRTEGRLSAEFFPGADAMWGNLQPALAYAVRFGVPQAADGYLRMTGASNWSSVRDAFNTRPVWGVAPPVGLEPRRQPAWLRDQPLNTWIEIPGTSGAGGAAIDAYSGMGLNEATSEIIIAAAGGHTDAADNRVVSLSLLADSPEWILRSPSSTSFKIDVPYYDDGRPTSRHLYQNIHVVERLNRVFLFGCRAGYGNAFNYRNVDAFDLDSNRWDPAGTWAPMLSDGDYGVVRIRATGEVYSNALRRWNPSTGQWSNFITQSSGTFVRWPVAHDSRRNQLFSLQWGDGQGFSLQLGLQASRVDLAGTVQSSVSFSSSTAYSQFQAERPTYAAMDYDPDNDRFLFYGGFGAAAGRIYSITPGTTNTWTMSVLELAAGSRLPASTPSGGAGVNSRFKYVPSLKGFILLPQRSANLWFIRTA